MLQRLRSVLDRVPLPEGTIPVAIGVVTLGITAYGFLALTARAVGPVRYGGFSALWALVFLMGPGFFLPLEQELARVLTARRVHGEAGGAVVRRAAVAGSGIAVLLTVAVIASGSLLTKRLFDGQWSLLIAFELGILSYLAEFVVRGMLSGLALFGRYGVVIGAEGLLRLLACLVFTVAGVHAVGAYGIALALAPLAAAATAFVGSRPVPDPGPEAPWSELSRSIGWLLAGSVFAQVLVNAGPVAVKALAGPSEKVIAGQFLAGLVIARVPLFLFQAVQAALLPKLTGLASEHRHADFRVFLRNIAAAVTTIAVLGTLAALLVGPTAVHIFFGGQFNLGRRDLALLAAGAGAYMVAVSLAQALIAVSALRSMVAGWAAGVAGFLIVTAAMTQLLLRVEVGLLAGGLVAAAWMSAAILSRIVRRQGGLSPSDEGLLELGHLPLEA